MAFVSVSVNHEFAFEEETTVTLISWLMTCNSFTDHILKQILPEGVEVPSSFETIVKYSLCPIFFGDVAFAPLSCFTI